MRKAGRPRNILSYCVPAAHVVPSPTSTAMEHSALVLSVSALPAPSGSLP